MSDLARTEPGASLLNILETVRLSPAVNQLIELAWAEDFGTAGDITSQALFPENHQSTAELVSRSTGVVAGLSLSEKVFGRIDQELSWEPQVSEGDRIHPNQTLARLNGSTRTILGAERLALNFLAHLSGIATATAALVELVEPFGTKVTDTRKTTPGWRGLEKYAVRVGGGFSHRFGLYDAVVIKDNHLAAAGSIAAAVAAVREQVGHLVKIEVEVDKLTQLDELLEVGADAVLLDNMDATTLTEAVRRVDGKMLTEASGGINLGNAAEIAATGVDCIAVGAITHSAPALDIGLDFTPS